MTIERVLEIILSVVAIFTAIVLHEYAHGYVAWRLGDPTARSKGRLTLNPLAHIDPIGTLLLPITLILLGGRPIGWAKPVPIDPRYFRNPLRGMLFVAAAGPGTNFALALATTVVGRALLSVAPDTVLFANSFGGNALRWLFFLLALFLIYNILLGLFNLIPIPPLDGSRILAYFLPVDARRVMARIERYGFIILIAVVYLGGLQWLFRFVMEPAYVLLGTRWLAALP